jgi:predicted DsbA family dithiol-disulfide isomerase
MSRPDSPPSPLEERGARSGIVFRRGRTLTSNSHLALEAAEFAEEQGRAVECHRAMFKAYFDDLENIGDLEAVVRVGAGAGLDPGGLRQALATGLYRDRVDEGIAWSRAIGVTAVPTFVFDDRYGMVGAQDFEAFQYMMEKLGRQPRA